ncbi:UNVERIFIED_CONTAM: Receptor-like protein EIX2 [Sesamum radiatum]|uniref:Receptor-like protein EIX2 n=1 Tax=Sesamum radiatum TaxID=300843 RepID=A0AAW2PXD7_SESRA
MQMLECLDLSRNQLSGEIPIGMAGLTYLVVLDLSNNNISGSIPSGTQLLGFSASVYAGNSRLSGPPLAACLASHGPQTSQMLEVTWTWPFTGVKSSRAAASNKTWILLISSFPPPTDNQEFETEGMDDHKLLLLVLPMLSLCTRYVFVSASEVRDGEVRCIESERRALLDFKQGLIDENGVLSSWGDEEHKKECCRWTGVVCSKNTRRVIGLQLNGAKLRDQLRGNISRALLELHHLNRLDLSNNGFHGNQIPEFISSFKKLQHLHLMNCGLSGIIPYQLGNVSNLKTLDLRYNPGLDVDNFDCLSNLSFLSLLDLTGVKISDTNWLRGIRRLSCLKELYLGSCDIPQLTPSSLDFFVNSSSASLAILDLSGTKMNSLVFSWLVNMSTSLVRVELSDNQIDGLIPHAFGSSIFLEYLDLSGNQLQGEIPKSFSKLSRLHFLDLSHNQLSGLVPEMRGSVSLRELHLSHNKLTGLQGTSFEQLPKLEILDVSYNFLQGIVSESHFLKLHSLKVLDLSFNSLAFIVSTRDWTPPFQLNILKLASCYLGPHFPKWVQTQSNISHLDLSSAGISDRVPKWLWDLSPRLQYLNLSRNHVRGRVPDLSSKFAGFPTIDISYNNFSGFLPLFNPNSSVLQLSRNMFRGSISSICTFSYTKLGLLDLSYNQLSGWLPDCWMSMTKLSILNLANNDISGEIPRTLGQSGCWLLVTLQLRSNNLSGELPSSLRNCQTLRLLDVGGNQLMGNVPTWIGTYLTRLMVLSLRDNKFYGTIPPEVCHLTEIQVLDISRNKISGRIPKCFNNFTSFVQDNRTTRSLIPITGFVFSDGSRYKIDSYIENALVHWKGQEEEYNKTLRFLKLIDLSSNRLVGNIPKEFSLLRGLISLNLSRNHLTGNIDSEIGQMGMLESLDLSRNQLSGEIPIGMAALNYLAVLDLSNNNLSGKIPPGTQLQGFDAMVYAGNNELCGRPLAACLSAGGPRPSPAIDHKKEDKNLDTGFTFLWYSVLFLDSGESLLL